MKLFFYVLAMLLPIFFSGCDSTTEDVNKKLKANVDELVLANSKTDENIQSIKNINYNLNTELEKTTKELKELMEESTRRQIADSEKILQSMIEYVPCQYTRQLITPDDMTTFIKDIVKPNIYLSHSRYYSGVGSYITPFKDGVLSKTLGAKICEAQEIECPKDYTNWTLEYSLFSLIKFMCK